MTRTGLFLTILAACAALVLAWYGTRPARLSATDLALRYTVPLPAPMGPMPVYHLGHSLVGRDMPAMLAELAGHDYASQLGWGASLQQHWTGDVPGFAAENASPAFRAAGAALDSGDYGAVVLTEMVELRDAIRYHDSPAALGRWAARAGAANPAVRVYLFETWHPTDDPAGWAARIAADGPALWQGILLAGAMADTEVDTIHVIPGGPVLAAIADAIAAGRLPGVASRDDLFARGAEGQLDTIHLNDLGNYVIALTHYAVISHRSPVGLSHQLHRADGTMMMPLDPVAARVMQEVVWTVVTGYPFSGVAKD
jgi:hypothetical protein